MPLLAQLALVSDTPALGVTELTIVAAALQKQISRDLSPSWSVQGTISPFMRLEDVPSGYWPIIVRDDIERDAGGFHCDNNGQPLALVTSGPGWSVIASHEAVEMIVDPFGNQMVAGQSLKPDQGRVEFLVEVCDPIGDQTYLVNDVVVSDFCTPRYFDPFHSSGVQYCFTGAIAGPRGLSMNGYLTWHDPVSNEWWQQSRFASGEPRVESLGALLKTACGLRATVDRLASKRRNREVSKDALPTSSEPKIPVKMTAATRRPGNEVGVSHKGPIDSSRAKAESWRSLIRDLTSKP